MTTKSSTLRLIYPQWQGGLISPWVPELSADDASLGYHLGAHLLNFLAPKGNQETCEVPVSLDVKNRETKNGISSYNAILKQTKSAVNILNEKKPDKIVTLGGECSVSVVPFTYLSSKYHDDIAFIWMDAHPDMCLPYDEYNGYHAMALSTSLGIGDEEILSTLPGKIDNSKVLLVGLRNFEVGGEERLSKFGIKSLSPQESNSTTIMDWIKQTGASKVTIHLDLDVLDPDDIIAAVGIVPDGLKMSEAIQIINDISSKYEIVGLTIAEPMPRVAIKLRNMLNQMPLLKD